MQKITQQENIKKIHTQQTIDECHTAIGGSFDTNKQ